MYKAVSLYLSQVFQRLHIKLCGNDPFENIHDKLQRDDRDVSHLGRKKAKNNTETVFYNLSRTECRYMCISEDSDTFKCMHNYVATVFKVPMK